MVSFGKYSYGAVAYLVYLLVILPGIMACAQLPEHARPLTLPRDEMPDFRPAGFTYRPLTVADFRAESLTGRRAAHGDGVNAQSVFRIRLTADSNFSLNRWPFFNQTRYFCSVNHLAFEAVMLPDLSWWNPKLKADKTGYVLQHEQIHFALTELAARQLTRDAEKWAANLLIIRDTPEEVYSEVRRQIREMIRSALEANRKRHEDFDQDTSLFHSPSWQQWWLETVEKELRRNDSDKNRR